MKNKKVKFEDLGLCKREKYRLNNIILALEDVEESLSICDYSQFAKKNGYISKILFMRNYMEFHVEAIIYILPYRTTILS